MNVQLIGTPRVIMQAPPPRNYFAWPTVARLNDGRLAVVASGFRLAHICPFGKTVISYSADEGKHYTQPVPAVDTVLDDRDGGICPLDGDAFLVTSFNNTVAFQRERGVNTPEARAYLDTVTPEAERAVYGSNFVITRDGGRTFSAPYRSPVTSPHGPARLSDGRVLWVGRVYPGEGEHGTHIEAWDILPDGSMRFTGAVPDVHTAAGEAPLCCEPHAIELPDGRVVCHIRAQLAKTMFTTYQSVSADGGRTWSAPRSLLPVKGGAPAHLLLLSSGVLLSVYGYRESPAGIRAMWSTDGGENWQTDAILYENDFGWDIGYPATVELKDGTLHTVFYAHLEAGGPAVILAQDWRLLP